jgi:Ca2+-binding EF-hand superfamily protein
MIDHSKDGKELTFLYDWMRIARKPHQTLRQDIQLLFELISIPVSESELDIIEKAISPAGTKTELKKEDLLSCFVVEEECRKPKEKELLKAFRYVSNEEDDISFSNLQDYFREEGIDSATSEMILKQLAEYENEQGKFDYKAFTANLY